MAMIMPARRATLNDVSAGRRSDAPPLQAAADAQQRLEQTRAQVAALRAELARAEAELVTAEAVFGDSVQQALQARLARRGPVIPEAAPSVTANWQF